MTDIQLSPQQQDAALKFEEWWKSDKTDRPIFRIFGFGGTGKSYLLKKVLQDAGLTVGAPPSRDDRDAGTGIVPDVWCATFTGKAAHVLRSRGMPATTIHSMIYSVSEASEEAVEKVKAEVSKLQIDEASADPKDAYSLRLMIQDKLAQIKDMKRPKFGLNVDSIVRDCKLIVLDEVSMVSAEMAGDLLSFKKPILVLGDPGQLAPIRGEGFFIQAVPDVMLTEIHRQALDSPIIRLSMMAREGKFIPFGRYSDDVWKLRQAEIDASVLASADQVITGKNATRRMINNALRQHARRSGDIPTEEDRVICLKNDNSVGLINGQFLKLTDIERERDAVFSARIQAETGETIGATRRNGKSERFQIYAGHFQDHVEFDENRADRDWKMKKGLVEADFGYGITVHKSQGSGWKNVCWVDDGLGRTREDRSRLVYTAITRAESGLLIIE